MRAEGALRCNAPLSNVLADFRQSGNRKKFDGLLKDSFRQV